MKAAFVNTNLMKPPVAPIGLEYVAEAVRASGHSVEVLDLCFEEHPESAVSRFFQGKRFDLVGLTLRNTDDCALATRVSFLDRFFSITSAVSACTDAVIVAGGAGYSVMPVQVLEKAGVCAGIWGPGEHAIPLLLERLKKKQEWNTVPNVASENGGRWRVMNKDEKEACPDIEFRRDLFDNRRYFREGGQAGFETKRGCSGRCIYCADPVSKGRVVRMRSPDSVASEIRSLLRQGIDVFHTCDSEFNIPPAHARAVCETLVETGLGERIRWYAYCAPAPFDSGLARLMRERIT